jgi:hypothetical protein
MLRATHHEEGSLRTVPQKESIAMERLIADHREMLKSDPFHNPNLALDNEQFRGSRDIKPSRGLNDRRIEGIAR